MTNKLTLVLALLAVAACSRGERPSEPAAEPEAAEGSAAADDGVAEEEAPAAPVATHGAGHADPHAGEGGAVEIEVETPFEEADVQALFDNWLATQNVGDFGAYQPLYAERFFGVKRSGPRIAEFDREGWLADREGMFEGVTVEASDVEIAMAGQLATINFTQRWASAQFEDVGPKRLVLAWNGEALQIAREEMIESTVVDDGRGVSQAERLGARPLVTLGDQLYVILDTEIPENPNYVGGAVNVERGLAASRYVRHAGGQGEGNQAGSYSDGATLRLYGEDGHICDARIGDQHVLSRMVPHFGSVQTWGGVDGAEPVPDAEVAAEVFELGAKFMVAELEHPRGECEHAIWAAPPGSGVRAYVNGEIVQELVELATTALMESEEWQQLQEIFEDEFDGEGPWHDYDGGGIDIAPYGTTEGPRILVVTASAGSGCGDFRGALTAVFRVSGRGESQNIGRRRSFLLGVIEPQGAFEADRSLHLVSEAGLWSFGDDDLTRWFAVDVPDYDCSC